MLKKLLYGFIMLLCQKALACGGDSVDVHLMHVEIMPLRPKQPNLLEFTLSKNESFLQNKLENNTSFYLKNYGINQLSSLSYRGFSAQQIDIKWNGISIRSPYLGQVDASQIDASLFNQTQFNENLFSTALCGGISLQDEYSNNSNGSFSFKTSTNNFSYLSTELQKTTAKNNIKTNASLQFGNFSYQYKTDNNSTYTTPKSPSYQFNILQKIAFKKSNIGFQYWISSSDRTLTPIHLQNTPTQFQQDFSIKTIALFNKNKKRFQYKQSVAGIIDYIQYSDTIIKLKIISTNEAVRNHMELSYTFCPRIITYVTSDASADFLQSKNLEKEQIFVFSSNNALGIKGSWNRLFYDGAVKIIQQRNQVSPLLGSIFLGYDGFLKIHSQATIQERFPTMNDLFWAIGGNKNVQKERSKNINLAVEYTRNQSLEKSKIQYGIKFNPFFYHIENMIQWLPTQSGYWSPTNNKTVETKGVETKLHAGFSRKKIHLKYEIEHTFLESIYKKSYLFQDNSIGKNLLYTPKNKISQQFFIELQKYSISLHHIYTDKRYTTTDNSSFLEPYHILNIQIGKSFLLKNRQIFFATLEANNALNQSYQEVANRYQPNRNFSIHLKYSWK